nr:hypothetical protein [Herbaspirillum sp. ASV7]
MITALMNNDTPRLKLKPRHIAVLGITAAFLLIRLLESLYQHFSG